MPLVLCQIQPQQSVNEIQANNVSNFKLIGNYPNPFNPSTTIEFSIPKTQLVSVVIYDVLGRQIKSLFNSELTSGKHDVVWDGKNNIGETVNSGVYFYTVKTSNKLLTGKMILQK